MKDPWVMVRVRQSTRQALRIVQESMQRAREQGQLAACDRGEHEEPTADLAIRRLFAEWLRHRERRRR